MKRSVTPSEMSVILETLLAFPPSSAGKRLRSERELSTLLGIDRMKVQKAFDLLVVKGILFRRHGSGTYVRKVPKTDHAPASLKVGSYSLSAEELFAKVTEKPMRWQIDQQRQLKLAVLPNLEWESDSNRAVFEGIKSRIKREGHQLKNMRLRPSAADAATCEELVKRLRGSSCDGYVLWTSYAPLLEQAFAGKLPPVVFIGAGDRDADLRCAPLVRVNLEDAVVRAVRILVEEGHRKVGIIGLKGVERNFEKERELYDETMDKLGLSFRSDAFCSLDHKAVESAMRRMFSSTVRPDAVYVADDVVLRHVEPVWKAMGIRPGENLGVITLANSGASLPAGYRWSCMEFNPFQVGRMAIDSLLQEIDTVGETICSFEHLATWREGETHRIVRKLPSRQKSTSGK